MRGVDDPAVVEIELRIAPEAAAQAIGVMHRAFDEYTAKGETSGAMLETPLTLALEIETGLGVAIARVDGRPVALAKHHDAGDGSLYFGRLGVVPEARGRGIASTLVAALREAARAEGLQGLSCLVRAQEDDNIALYERLGMVIVERGEKVSRTGAVIPVVAMRDASIATGGLRRG
ncbi:GNAT family N-acetyltransferase [Demequina capsici]|uniref:GNAT family N-acetyltransferase n=1 Tax=Demequina capsici TaxID=3075620 RepID=A0AA96FD60_9MICO|nr:MULTISPECIES: GNAT family N-acetyltransferase [unclassified Demequina]WNM23287.1 GNAT family N-acetyltransferase [Demequina sp. OYTSA14]WNM26165.1 GNAT family N-acetyltransferase [Demequina sp. PMTSA13]